MADDAVQLTDLEVIQRWSLAVRSASAPRDELVAALRADIAWLEGRRTSRASRVADEPDAVDDAVDDDVDDDEQSVPSAPARRTPAPRRSTPSRRTTTASKRTTATSRSSTKKTAKPTKRAGSTRRR